MTMKLNKPNVYTLTIFKSQMHRRIAQHVTPQDSQQPGASDICTSKAAIIISLTASLIAGQIQVIDSTILLV